MGLFFKKKKKEEIIEEAPAPRLFNENVSYKLLGIDVDVITPLAKKTTGFPFDYDELKDMYDIGDKVYEYELYAHADRLSIKREADFFFVFLDNQKIGHISKQKTEELQGIITNYGIKRLNLEIAFGRFQKVEQNDNPDTEMYGENDNKWITFDYVDKPTGTIIAGYDRPLIPLGGLK